MVETRFMLAQGLFYDALGLPTWASRREILTAIAKLKDKCAHDPKQMICALRAQHWLTEGRDYYDGQILPLLDYVVEVTEAHFGTQFKEFSIEYGLFPFAGIEKACENLQQNCHLSHVVNPEEYFDFLFRLTDGLLKLRKRAKKFTGILKKIYISDPLLQPVIKRLLEIRQQELDDIAAHGARCLEKLKNLRLKNLRHHRTLVEQVLQELDPNLICYFSTDDQLLELVQLICSYLSSPDWLKTEYKELCDDIEVLKCLSRDIEAIERNSAFCVPTSIITNDVYPVISRYKPKVQDVLKWREDVSYTLTQLAPLITSGMLSSRQHHLESDSDISAPYLRSVYGKVKAHLIYIQQLKKLAQQQRDQYDYHRTLTEGFISKAGAFLNDLICMRKMRVLNGLFGRLLRRPHSIRSLAKKVLMLRQMYPVGDVFQELERSLQSHTSNRETLAYLEDALIEEIQRNQHNLAEFRKDIANKTEELQVLNAYVEELVGHLDNIISAQPVLWQLKSLGLEGVPFTFFRARTNIEEVAIIRNNGVIEILDISTATISSTVTIKEGQRSALLASIESNLILSTVDGRVLMRDLKRPSDDWMETDWYLSEPRSIDADGMIISFGSKDGSVYIYQLPDLVQVNKLQGLSGRVQYIGVAASAGIGIISTSSIGSELDQLHIWSFECKSPPNKIFSPSRVIRFPTVNKEGKLFAFADGSRPSRILIWNLESFRLKKVLVGCEGTAGPLAFAKYGDVWALIGSDSVNDPNIGIRTDLVVWDVFTNTVLCRYKAHAGPIKYLAANWDYSVLVSSASDCVVAWDLAAVLRECYAGAGSQVSDLSS